MGLYDRGITLEKKEKEKDVQDLESVKEAVKKVDSEVEEKKLEKNPDKEFRTGIDRLYHLVKISKRITVSEIKKIIEGDEENLDNWIRILENQGLVTVEYPPGGGTVVVVKGIKPEEFSIKKMLHWGKNEDEGKS
jgi:soluble cytochrome b562